MKSMIRNKIEEALERERLFVKTRGGWALARRDSTTMEVDDWWCIRIRYGQRGQFVVASLMADETAAKLRIMEDIA